ncbi:MAG TPA: putative zinc-binding metallopeptidase [Pyrinomonadaceae bacterium]|nr:putative zinc-binding metallopeptidase [Pyrinomonadaceae bacterium]
MSESVLRTGRFLLLILLVELSLVGTADAQQQAQQQKQQQKKAQPAAFAALAKVAKAYNIEIVTADLGLPVQTTHGAIEGRPAAQQELENYADLFVQEFTLYPTALVKRARLKRVVLCNEVAFAGQRRNAVPDFEHDTLYLDVSRGAYNKLYLRKVIHHEFFHIVDYRDDGSVYKDDLWAALNPSGFQYGTGGRNAQDKPDTSLLTDKYPGFLNHYSTTGVEEDKAEMFANMFVEPAYVESRMKKDAVLRSKVVLMKSLLGRFCPDMSDAFWDKLRRRG